MSQIDWSKAPDGATHYRASIKTFYRQDVSAYEWDTVEWRMIANDLGEFRWSSDLIELPVSEWTGEGLPPVGLKVEAYFSNDTNPCWLPFTLHYISDVTVVFDGGRGETCRERQFINSLKFRQIRTPEQITAEERANQIKEICKDLDVPLAIAARAFEKGYRKFEIVDN